MKGKTSKLLSILLAIVMVAGLLPDMGVTALTAGAGKAILPGAGAVSGYDAANDSYGRHNGDYTTDCASEKVAIGFDNGEEAHPCTYKNLYVFEHTVQAKPDCILTEMHITHTYIDYDSQGYSLSNGTEQLTWQDGNSPSLADISIDSIGANTAYIFEDEACTRYVQSKPQTGKDYYVRLSIWNHNHIDYKLDFSRLTKSGCKLNLNGADTECIGITGEGDGGWYEVNVVFRLRPKAELVVKTLKDIVITALPDKTVYTEGAYFEPTGMVVMAVYNTGDTKQVWDYDYMPDGALKTGDRYITISYTEGGFTYSRSISITVKPSTLVALTELAASADIVYNGNVYVLAEDNIRLAWENDEQASDRVFAGLGYAVFTDESCRNELTESPKAETDYYAYFYVFNSIENDHNIDFSKLTKDNCKLDITGYDTECIKITREDGDGFDSIEGVFKLRKNGISDRTLERIDVTTPPDKTEYTAGESFDKAGMVVTATYSNGSSAPVTTYTVIPSGALKTTDTSVTISYTEDGVNKVTVQRITVRMGLTTEDGGAFDIGKILRWKGMQRSDVGDIKGTNEPTNRGYDPDSISMTLRLSGASTQGDALEALQDARFERVKHGGFEMLSKSISGSTMTLSYTANGKTVQVMSIGVYLQDGGIYAKLTSLAPGAIKLTLEGREYLIVTPGDVNLDGEMNANDWGTVMRVLAEAAGEYDVSNYPGFTVNSNPIDLWALLADMTSTGCDGRSSAVDANDWGTMMYLLAEAWK